VRPEVPAEVLAAMLGAAGISVPPAPPAVARSWTVEEAGEDLWTVVGPDFRMRVRAPWGKVGGADDFRCTCGAARPCPHALAIAALWAPSDAVVPAKPPAPAPLPEEEPVDLDDAQLAAARHASEAVSALLAHGATATGDVVDADLSRALHGAKATKLHRLARALARVVRMRRDLEGSRSHFVLSRFADDVAEALLVARALQAPPVGDRWVGTGRRAYLPLGTLQLWGLLTEPVVAASGFAGVSTVLADASGRAWTVGTVLPAPAEYVWDAYDSPARVGGTMQHHRRLGRDGLLLHQATGSWDGRLGAGAGVFGQTTGRTSWTEEPLASLWKPPLSEQVQRALASGRGPAGDLVFLVLVVAGAHKDALVAEPPGGPPLRLVAPVDHPDLAWRENLRLLARAPGLAIRAVARLIPDRRRSLGLLAIGPAPAVDPTAPVLNLPEVWSGRANLGLDKVLPAMISGLQPRPVEARWEEPADAPDPLAPLRRRVERAVLGGPVTLPPEALPRVEAEARALEAALLPTGAAALRGLAAGARRPEAFGEAWLAARIVEEVGTREILRATWL
jgi:hypothetical protein